VGGEEEERREKRRGERTSRRPGERRVGVERKRGGERGEEGRGDNE